MLRHAAAIARRHGAHVRVTHCRPRPEDLLPFGVPIPAIIRDQVLDQSRQIADLEEAGLRDELVTLAARLGLGEPIIEPIIESRAAAQGSGPTVDFVEEAGRQVDVIKHHGRLADLIAVAQPDRDRSLGANTLKAALFNTGRPVLMCPPAPPPETLGSHLAIAWNGSIEAARAVAMALPLIEAAETVSVVTIGKVALHGASTEDFMEYLALRGVQASQRIFVADKSVGQTILFAAGELGADLLLMGAYGDRHERETLFGGNTQTVVDMATLPVVMVH